MKARTISIVALATALGLVMALTLLRSRQPLTDTDPPVPLSAGTVDVEPVDPEDVQDAHRLVTGHEEAREESLKNEAREEGLARAREEQQERWQGLRRDQAFSVPMEQALRDARIVPDAIDPSPSEVLEQAAPFDSESIDRR